MLPGYADYETYRKELESIAPSKRCALRSLGRTLEGGSDRRELRP
jgi:hypothetical protein